MGSSTSDCIAAVRAVAGAVGVQLHERELARMVVEAEKASDSTMFTRAVLFAQREGVVLEDFVHPLPHLEVLAFNTAHHGVDTLTLKPAEYNWQEVEAFAAERERLRQAICTQDAHLLGQVTSASARINQKYLPKPHFEQLEKIGERWGALGLAAAHSGTVMGLLFATEDSGREDRISKVQYLVTELGFTPIDRFSIGSKRLIAA